MCSGTFFLAAAGVLDGKRAATHWRVVRALKKLHPQIEVDGESIYVRDGNVWIANADGTDAHDVSRQALGGITAASWSPDGRHLAARLGREVLLFGPDGEDMRRTDDVVPYQGLGDDLVWSPDGLHLAFATRVRDARYDIDDPKRQPPRRITPFFSRLDDVGTALDLGGKAGAPLATTLGRHTNDQMVSFYVVTPSGFEVEYGWGGRKIDDATWEPATYDRISIWGHHPPGGMPSGGA